MASNPLAEDGTNNDDVCIVRTPKHRFELFIYEFIANDTWKPLGETSYQDCCWDGGPARLFTDETMMTMLMIIGLGGWVGLWFSVGWQSSIMSACACVCQTVDDRHGHKLTSSNYGAGGRRVASHNKPSLADKLKLVDLKLGLVGPKLALLGSKLALLGLNLARNWH